MVHSLCLFKNEDHGQAWKKTVKRRAKISLRIVAVPTDQWRLPIFSDFRQLLFTIFTNALDHPGHCLRTIVPLTLGLIYLARTKAAPSFTPSNLTAAVGRLSSSLLGTPPPPTNVATPSIKLSTAKFKEMSTTCQKRCRQRQQQSRGERNYIAVEPNGPSLNQLSVIFLVRSGPVVWFAWKPKCLDSDSGLYTRQRPPLPHFSIRYPVIHS